MLAKNTCARRREGRGGEGRGGEEETDGEIGRGRKGGKEEGRTMNYNGPTDQPCFW